MKEWNSIFGGIKIGFGIEMDWGRRGWTIASGATAPEGTRYFQKRTSLSGKHAHLRSLAGLGVGSGQVFRMLSGGWEE